MLEAFIGVLTVRLGDHIDRLRRHFCASLVAIFAIAVTLAISGCWLAAAQLAPIAVSVAENVGASAVELTAGVGASSRDQDAIIAKRLEAGREADMESGDSCRQLDIEIPGVIELRRSAAGAPEYRELQVTDALDQPQWAPITENGTTADGWRPAVNFLQMNFSPPLGAVVPETASSFLAYTPSKFVTAADGDRLTAMTSNFGKPLGTFTWNGNYYHYVVTSTLPCFPPPSERIAADIAPPPGL
jgi:hypothetical protein